MATVAIPMKVKVRDLISKSWLVFHLANEGHNVVIGHQGEINNSLLDEIRPEIYIGNKTVFSDRELYEMLSEVGCIVGLLDPEGNDFNDKLAGQISSDNIDVYDFLLLWGQRSKECFVKETTFDESHMYVTGYPGFDLLQPKLREVYRPQATEYRKRHGNYVLINTNFSHINGYTKENRDTIKELYKIYGQPKKEYMVALVANLCNAVARIAEEGEQDTVVVRPHPSEWLGLYKHYFSDLDSVIVSNSGDVRPWILGADAVIHNRCTTGIESVLLDTPVIAYEPSITIGEYDYSHLSNDVSEIISTPGKLVHRIKEITCQPDKSPDNQYEKSKLEPSIANIEDQAAPKVCKVVNSYLSENTTNTYPELDGKQRLKYWMKNQPLAPYVWQVRNRQLTPRRSNKTDDAFSGLEFEEVKSTIERFKQVINADVEFNIDRVNRYYEIYKISKDNM